MSEKNENKIEEPPTEVEMTEVDASNQNEKTEICESHHSEVEPDSPVTKKSDERSCMSLRPRKNREQSVNAKMKTTSTTSVFSGKGVRKSLGKRLVTRRQRLASAKANAKITKTKRSTVKRSKNTTNPPKKRKKQLEKEVTKMKENNEEKKIVGDKMKGRRKRMPEKKKADLMEAKRIIQKKRLMNRLMVAKSLAIRKARNVSTVKKRKLLKRNGMRRNLQFFYNPQKHEEKLKKMKKKRENLREIELDNITKRYLLSGVKDNGNCPNCYVIDRLSFVSAIYTNIVNQLLNDDLGTIDKYLTNIFDEHSSLIFSTTTFYSATFPFGSLEEFKLFLRKPKLILETFVKVKCHDIELMEEMKENRRKSKIFRIIPLNFLHILNIKHQKLLTRYLTGIFVGQVGEEKNVQIFQLKKQQIFPFENLHVDGNEYEFYQQRINKRLTYSALKLRESPVDLTEQFSDGLWNRLSKYCLVDESGRLVFVRRDYSEIIPQHFRVFLQFVYQQFYDEGKNCEKSIDENIEKRRNDMKSSIPELRDVLNRPLEFYKNPQYEIGEEIFPQSIMFFEWFDLSFRWRLKEMGSITILEKEENKKDLLRVKLDNFYRKVQRDDEFKFNSHLKNFFQILKYNELKCKFYTEIQEHFQQLPSFHWNELVIDIFEFCRIVFIVTNGKLSTEVRTICRSLKYFTRRSKRLLREFFLSDLYRNFLKINSFGKNSSLLFSQEELYNCGISCCYCLNGLDGGNMRYCKEGKIYFHVYCGMTNKDICLHCNERMTIDTINQLPQIDNEVDLSEDDLWKLNNVGDGSKLQTVNISRRVLHKKDFFIINSDDNDDIDDGNDERMMMDGLETTTMMDVDKSMSDEQFDEKLDLSLNFLIKPLSDGDGDGESNVEFLNKLIIKEDIILREEEEEEEEVNEEKKKEKILIEKSEIIPSIEKSEIISSIETDEKDSNKLKNNLMKNDNDHMKSQHLTTTTTTTTSVISSSVTMPVPSKNEKKKQQKEVEEIDYQLDIDLLEILSNSDNCLSSNCLMSSISEELKEEYLRIRVSSKNTISPWQYQSMSISSINQLVHCEGEIGRIWYVIPEKEISKCIELSYKFIKNYELIECYLMDILSMFTPKFLLANGIEVQRHHQKFGDYIVLGKGCIFSFVQLSSDYCVSVEVDFLFVEEMLNQLRIERLMIEEKMKKFDGNNEMNEEKLMENKLTFHSKFNLLTDKEKGLTIFQLYQGRLSFYCDYETSIQLILKEIFKEYHSRLTGLYESSSKKYVMSLILHCLINQQQNDIYWNAPKLTYKFSKNFIEQIMCHLSMDILMVSALQYNSQRNNVYLEKHFYSILKELLEKNSQLLEDVRYEEVMCQLTEKIGTSTDNYFNCLSIDDIEKYVNDLTTDHRSSSHDDPFLKRLLVFLFPPNVDDGESDGFDLKRIDERKKGMRIYHHCTICNSFVENIWKCCCVKEHVVCSWKHYRQLTCTNHQIHQSHKVYQKKKSILSNIEVISVYYLLSYSIDDMLKWRVDCEEVLECFDQMEKRSSDDYDELMTDQLSFIRIHELIEQFDDYQCAFSTDLRIRLEEVFEKIIERQYEICCLLNVLNIQIVSSIPSNFQVTFPQTSTSCFDERMEKNNLKNKRVLTKLKSSDKKKIEKICGNRRRSSSHRKNDELNFKLNLMKSSTISNKFELSQPFTCGKDEEFLINPKMRDEEMTDNQNILHNLLLATCTSSNSTTTITRVTEMTNEKKRFDKRNTRSEDIPVRMSFIKENANRMTFLQFNERYHKLKKFNYIQTFEANFLRCLHEQISKCNDDLLELKEKISHSNLTLSDYENILKLMSHLLSFNILPDHYSFFLHFFMTYRWMKICSSIMEHQYSFQSDFLSNPHHFHLIQSNQISSMDEQIISKRLYKGQLERKRLYKRLLTKYQLKNETMDHADIFQFPQLLVNFIDLIQSNSFRLYLYESCEDNRKSKDKRRSNNQSKKPRLTIEKHYQLMNYLFEQYGGIIPFPSTTIALRLLQFVYEKCQLFESVQRNFTIDYRFSQSIEWIVEFLNIQEFECPVVQKTDLKCLPINWQFGGSFFPILENIRRVNKFSKEIVESKRLISFRSLEKLQVYANRSPIDLMVRRTLNHETFQLNKHLKEIFRIYQISQKKHSNTSQRLIEVLFPFLQKNFYNRYSHKLKKNRKRIRCKKRMKLLIQRRRSMKKATLNIVRKRTKKKKRQIIRVWPQYFASIFTPTKKEKSSNENCWKLVRRLKDKCFMSKETNWKNFNRQKFVETMKDYLVGHKKHMMEIRERNLEKLRNSDISTNLMSSNGTSNGGKKRKHNFIKFCSCQSIAYGPMIRCDICYEWFHLDCSKLKYARSENRSDFKRMAPFCIHTKYFNSIDNNHRYEIYDRYLCVRCKSTSRKELNDLVKIAYNLRMDSNVFCVESEMFMLHVSNALAWTKSVHDVLDGLINNSDELVKNECQIVLERTLEQLKSSNVMSDLLKKKLYSEIAILIEIDVLEKLLLDGDLIEVYMQEKTTLFQMIHMRRRVLFDYYSKKENVQVSYRSTLNKILPFNHSYQFLTNPFILIEERCKIERNLLSVKMANKQQQRRSKKVKKNVGSRSVSNTPFKSEFHSTIPTTPTSTMKTTISTTLSSTSKTMSTIGKNSISTSITTNPTNPTLTTTTTNNKISSSSLSSSSATTTTTTTTTTSKLLDDKELLNCPIKTTPSKLIGQEVKEKDVIVKSVNRSGKTTNNFSVTHKTNGTNKRRSKSTTNVETNQIISSTQLDQISPKTERVIPLNTSEKDGENSDYTLTPHVSEMKSEDKSEEKQLPNDNIFEKIDFDFISDTSNGDLQSDVETEEEGQSCASLNCLHPKEETISWVLCDYCKKWFHMTCANINRSREEVAKSFFICHLCIRDGVTKDMIKQKIGKNNKKREDCDQKKSAKLIKPKRLCKRRSTGTKLTNNSTTTSVNDPSSSTVGTSIQPRRTRRPSRRGKSSRGRTPITRTRKKSSASNKSISITENNMDEDGRIKDDIDTDIDEKMRSSSVNDSDVNEKNNFVEETIIIPIQRIPLPKVVDELKLSLLNRSKEATAEVSSTFEKSSSRNMCKGKKKENTALDDDDESDDDDHMFKSKLPCMFVKRPSVPVSISPKHQLSQEDATMINLDFCLDSKMIPTLNDNVKNGNDKNLLETIEDRTNDE